MDNTGFAVASLAKVAVMVFDWGLLAMAVTYVLEVVVVACLLWWVLIRKNQIHLYRQALSALTTPALYKHIRITLPLLLTAFIQALYLRIDQLIVASYLSPHELGLYATSMRMADIAAVFPIIVTTALYPMLARQYALPGQVAFVAMYRGMLTALVFGALAFILIIQFFSVELTTLLFGPSFAGSAWPLRLLVLSTLTTYVGYMWHAWMVLENQGALLFRSSVVSVVVSFAGSMWLVPRYGIEGAAFSTAVAFIASALYAFSLHAPKVFFGHVWHAATHPVSNIKGLYLAVRPRVQD
jgi:O-antigen/teichoic acid export membrane protein